MINYDRTLRTSDSGEPTSFNYFLMLYSINSLHDIEFQAPIRRLISVMLMCI